MSTLRERTHRRMAQSIAGEPSDGHSVFYFYTYPFYQNVTGMPLPEYFHDPKMQLDMQAKVLDMLDGVGNLCPDVGSVAEASSFGCPVRFDNAGFISVHEYPGLKDIEDADEIDELLHFQGPYGDNYMKVALETLKYMVENCPERYKVNPPVVMGPFTVACQMFGPGDFCEMTLIDPDIVTTLMDRIVEAEIAYMKEMEKILGSLHHILVCDDISAFLSPGLFEEFVMPYYDKLFAEFPNTQRWLHNDANAKHIAHLIPKCGFKAWQYGPCMTAKEAAELTGNQVTLFGGFKPLELANMSLEEVETKLNELFDEFDGNPKQVVATMGSVNQVPLENLKLILKMCDERKI